MFFHGFTCDNCGAGRQYNYDCMTKKELVRGARKHGWSVGKRGILCPTCRKVVK